MKILISTLLILPLIPAYGEAKMSCTKSEGNLCYRINASQRSRIDRSQAFQKALGAMARKLENKGVVYIVQGYRTPREQQRLVDQHCGGRSSCAGYASARTSRHVISVAADPMVMANVVKPLCYAENQARTEFLGPRSAAAVYGYGNKATWGHIDDSTGSNYTPRNCGRNEGMGVAMGGGSGAPTSKKVDEYKKEKEEQRKPAAVAEGNACYFAILSCSKSLSGANAMRSQLGGSLSVVNTSDVPAFANGWYCVTSPPSSRAEASATVQNYRSKAPSAYVKKGC